MQPIRFDIKRLALGEVVAAAGSATLMIGIALPWFRFGSTVAGYYSFNAIELRNWMYGPFFLSLAVVVSVILSATRRRSPIHLFHWFVLVAACSADLVATVACFVKKAPGLDWDFGAYVSLAAAAVALLGAIISRRASSATTTPRSVTFATTGRRARPLVPASPRQANIPRTGPPR
jgi:hypothetical protein